MKNITYLVGDATQPIGDEDRVIAHICNNVGAWGAGFVLALSARDTAPERHYRMWAAGHGCWKDKAFKLGESQTIYNFADENIRVVNMVAQDNIGRAGQLVSYLYLWRCLLDLRDNTWARGETVHMPRIGCGIGGGEWPMVAALIEGTLCKANVPVFVYDYDERARFDALHKWGSAAFGQ